MIVNNTQKRKNVLIICGAVIILSIPQTSLSWSPTGGEETRLFNQLVTEQLVFVPQTPIKNWRGRTVGWRGPTYQQQWNWEHKRQMDNANRAARDRNATIANSRGQMATLKDSMKDDQKIRDLKTKRAQAQARVNLAQSIEPDGPTNIEVNRRLRDPETAGGQLDANKDGVISESEMKTALASRVSMQKTQYLDEKKLNVSGGNEITPAETRRGLMQVAGVGTLDHNKMLSDARKDPAFKETGIGTGTYTDAKGVTRNISTLSNTSARSQELAGYTAQKNAYANSRDNNKMTATKLRNGQLPTTTTRYAAITTTGTRGTTRSWNGSWDAGGGMQRGQNQIQSQMSNPNAGKNNAFYNQIQTSNAGFQQANSQARASLANAQRLQNSTTGFRNAQSQVQATYNSINR